jgi:hypothetical protein
MEFAIMVWRSAHGGTSSVYGVLDPTNPGKLPGLGKGHWGELRRVREDRFPQAAEAKKAIASDGFYLYGTKVDVMEQEGGGQPPSRG